MHLTLHQIRLPTGCRVLNGFILIDATAEVLGGRVPELVRRWNAQQELATRPRGTGDGPPPFVPFSEASDEGMCASVRL
jgi:hypothetical protein